MTSRLTALAALFAVVTTASIGYAATVHTQRAATAPLPVIELPRVEVVGKRVS